MGKKVTYTEKYWFALGYHHKKIDEISPPDVATQEAYSSYFNVDIFKEYEAGITAAEKDMNNGI